MKPKLMRRATAMLTVGVLMVSMTLCQTRTGRGTSSGVDRVFSGDLRLQPVAQFEIPSTMSYIGVNLSSKTGEIYLTDFDNGKILRADWKTNRTGDWVPLDSKGCFLVGAHILQVRVMRSAPFLVVSNCNRIELLDAKTFRKVKTVFEENNVEVYGFDLSPDERTFAVTVRKILHSPAYPNHVHAEEPYTIAYDTSDWKVKGRWSFAYGYFTPDGRSLATSFAGSHPGTSQCGFTLYDADSGRMVSHCIAQVDEELCPSFPSHFRPDLPSHAITDDYPHSAVSEWDINTGKLVRHLKDETTGPGPAPGTKSLSLSYDGRLAAVVRSRTEGVPDHSVTVWDLSVGTAVYHTLVRIEADPVRRVIFSSDGNHVAFVRAGRVDVYRYDLE